MTTTLATAVVPTDDQLAPDDDPEFLRDLAQDIRRRKHHPQEPAGGHGASKDGADEDP